MQPAFLADQALAINRNSGVAESHHLPPGRVLSRDEFFTMVPETRELPATGGALWHDYKTDEGDRLTLSFALGAARFGAVLANYADAFEPIRDGSRIVGMKVRDAATGDIIDVRARVTVNAAGADAARVMAAFGARRVFPLLKAMNVVTTRQASGPAVALPSKGGRLLVALPWRGRLTIGTSHGLRLCGADDTSREGRRGERVPGGDQFRVSVAGYSAWRRFRSSIAAWSRPSCARASRRRCAIARSSVIMQGTASKAPYR